MDRLLRRVAPCKPIRVDDPLGSTKDMIADLQGMSYERAIVSGVGFEGESRRQIVLLIFIASV